ncbi:DNA replication and repair protein RecF [termite gut metagenome]|uniref:DNA replication and repair protein RecF n=1 Tax=termite gut metagenome TaxID=433724 RepID=A0A5J4RZK4_9ZZZZ
MYISQIEIHNFRKYKDLTLNLNKGLNVFVGENNSGKTAIIDAIRYVIDPDNYSVRIQENDFNAENNAIEITLKFADLSSTEEYTFMEFLTFEDVEAGIKPSLYLSLTATEQYLHRWIRAGKDKDIDIDFQVREQIHTAYFRPLRDAENELAPSQQSRLSKILQIYGKKHPDSKAAILNNLHTFNESIKTQDVIKNSNADTTNNLTKLLLYPDKNETKTKIDIPQTSDADKNFRHISERLKLDFAKETKQGLGYYNLLFMAAELILLRNEGESKLSSFLLIEEPEAHLHPQLQYNLLKFVQEEIAKPDVSSLQVFITTHSPNISSKVNVENLILLTSEDNNAYSLREGATKADTKDYKFITKFLDTTKANMFFAKGIIFVEGFSEEILFPVFAKMLGYDLEDYGVSIISINGTSHERYAKILQRQDGTELPIPASFVRDADNLKDATLSDKKENIETTTMLKFFSSSEKTLEYDIAKSMWQQSCATLKSLYVNIPA